LLVLAVGRWRLALEYKVDIIFISEVGGVEVLVVWITEFLLWLVEAFYTGRTAEKAVQPVARTGSLKLDIFEDRLSQTRFWHRATRPTVFSTVGRGRLDG